jgi:molecular chaperone DnaJ
MDFYIVLGINRDASLPEVKRAYRRLARRLHPDVNPGDERAAVRFREVAEAYATLSDPSRRDRYDQLGYEAPVGEAHATGFEGFDFSAGVFANQQSTFGDLFADVLRGESARSMAPERGHDLHQTLSLSFEQAAAGGEFHLSIVRQENCRECAGTGLLSTAAVKCPSCDGVGSLRTARGHMVFAQRCERCDGTGALTARACPGCNGAGSVSRAGQIAVPVPAGIADEGRIRIAGRGSAGHRGGPPGDLYVSVRVAPHPLFRREGDDLHLVVPVAVHEAALGARVEVPTAQGWARLRVPPGAQSGQRLRMRGRGLPSPRSGRRGDLVVEIRLVLPAVLDERSKVLLKQFGDLNGESVREQFDRSWKTRSEAARERAVD